MGNSGTCITELAATRHYVNACVDPDVRQTVTMRTQMGDVEDVWVFATKLYLCGLVELCATKK